MWLSPACCFFSRRVGVQNLPKKSCMQAEGCRATSRRTCPWCAYTEACPDRWPRNSGILPTPHSQHQSAPRSSPVSTNRCQSAKAHCSHLLTPHSMPAAQIRRQSASQSPSPAGRGWWWGRSGPQPRPAGLRAGRGGKQLGAYIASAPTNHQSAQLLTRPHSHVPPHPSATQPPGGRRTAPAGTEHP
jgi:hypothetical protein